MIAADEARVISVSCLKAEYKNATVWSGMKILNVLSLDLEDYVKTNLTSKRALTIT